MRRALVLCIAGCASFEDPTLVIDLRVLGIQTTPSEQIIEIDFERAPTIDALLAQLPPITVRAVIADPGHTRDLAWSMTACVLDAGGRCDPDRTSIPLRSGQLLDPESSSRGDCVELGVEDGGVVCAQITPDARLGALLDEVFREDPVAGAAGIEYGVSLRISSATVEPVYASKRIRVAPRTPRERVANRNPHIEQLLLGSGGVGVEVESRHCAGATRPVPTVRAGRIVTLFPVSREGDKEDYVLPTLDGGLERFTENLSYQWVATSGSFSDENTGGAPDAFGNYKLDGTDWTAPLVSAPTLVSIWVVQRDGRLGVTWREACVSVTP